MQIKDYSDFNKLAKIIEINAKKNENIDTTWSGPSLGKNVVPVWLSNKKGTLGMWFTQSKLTLHEYAGNTIPNQMFDMSNIVDALPTEEYIRIVFNEPVTFKCGGNVFENIKAIKIDLADFAKSIGYTEES